MAIHYYENDLPPTVSIQGDIAVDTEAMGLNTHRDRLCTVQIGTEAGEVYVVHFPTPNYNCPNLKKLLSNPKCCYIFHFARFDVAIIEYYLKIEFSNIYCTKIASRLCRTYTDKHGLKDICDELLGVKIVKGLGASDWGHAKLTDEQLHYAAHDVLYLHSLRDKLNVMLEREGRKALAESCFKFLPTRARLDYLGWPEFDIFQH